MKRRRERTWSPQPPILVKLVLVVLVVLVARAGATTSDSNHWAVLVCSSRYWFNYRHLANTLSMYRTIRQLGIPDERIIMMSASDAPCNPRNPHPGIILTSNDGGTSSDVYGLDDVEMDYQGEDASVESLLRVLTGNHFASTPLSRRLRTNADSHVLVFLSGHGGDEFLKFHDTEELTAADLGYALGDMHAKGRYKEVLLLIDTCQAATLATHITAPGVTTVSSSLKGENSYAQEARDDLGGVAVIDRFTHATTAFFRRNSAAIAQAQRDRRNNETGTAPASSRPPSGLSLQDYVSSLDARALYSTASVQTSPQARNPRDVPLLDFFAGGRRFETVYSPMRPAVPPADQDEDELEDDRLEMALLQEYLDDEDDDFSL